MGVWFVAVPGFKRGDAVLTSVFIVDLAALALAAIPTLAAAARADRRTGWWLLGVCAGATIGDGYVAAGGLSPAVTALSWTAASICLVGAATCREIARANPQPEDDQDDEHSAFVVARIVLPPLGVIAFPLAAAILAARHELTSSGALYFAVFFVTTLLLAFGRQGYLLLDNRRAVIRERRLRGEVVRRNEELEALTGLAATMTETLEEDADRRARPRGAQARRARVEHRRCTCPRRTSRLELHAAAGELADRLAVGHARRAVRLDARRSRRAAAVRSSRLAVSRARPLHRARHARAPLATTRSTEPSSASCACSSTRSAIALQNARDYRDKLEQAIRDPLTGLSTAATSRGVREGARAQRALRQLGASLVLFDVDDFKQINDTLGHAAATRSCARSAGSRLARSAAPTLRAHRRRGVRAAAARDLAARRAARRRAHAHARSPRRRSCPTARSRSAAASPPAREDAQRARGARAARRRRALLGQAQRQEHVRRGQRGRRRRRPATSATACSPTSTRSSRRSTHSTCTRATTRENVAAYAVAIGEHLGLDARADRPAAPGGAAARHRQGRGAAARSSTSRRRSTDAEFDEIKRARRRGRRDAQARRLRRARRAGSATTTSASDGRGYPDGLAGNDIPLEARIIFVADSFEAMTSDRPYHRGMPVDDAVAELRRCAGTQFDGRLIEALVELLEQDRLPVLALRESA